MVLPATQASSLSTKILVGVLIVVNLGLLGVAIPSLVYVKRALESAQTNQTSPLDHLAAQYLDALPDSLLPNRYIVNRSYWLPPTDQGRRGTCWAWSTIFLLQSQYRAQGIRDGFLAEDEYVNLSTQAFLSLVGNWCRQNKTAPVCQYGGFLKDTTSDGQVEAFPLYVREIPSLLQSIVPESVCPYLKTENNVTDFQCDGLTEAIRTNPISFTIKSYSTAYDTRGTKQLLYRVGRPIGIGTPLGTITYYVKCEGDIANTSDCLASTYPCPDDPNGSFCHLIALDGRPYDGYFLSANDVSRIRQYSGHAMNILGWNDNWAYHSRFAAPPSVAQLKGAFILHNSWGATGHSVDFLMGERTLENEQATCPNHNDSITWIPCAYDEFVGRAGRNYTQCSTDLRHIRGHGRTMHADLLVCANGAYCNLGEHYLIGRAGDDVNTTALDNGLYLTEVINIENPSAPQRSQLLFPFWGLGRVFRIAEGYVANDDFDCGYYALPYETLEAVRRRAWDLFDNYKASDIEVEFTPTSYATSPDVGSDKNLTHLRLSTYRIQRVTFDGPIPFKLIYPQ